MLTHKLRQCIEPLQSASQIIHVPVFQITVDMVNDTSFEGDMYCTCEDLNVYNKLQSDYYITGI